MQKQRSALLFALFLWLPAEGSQSAKALSYFTYANQLINEKKLDLIQKEEVDRVVTKYGIDRPDQHSWFFLHSACQVENFALVQYLVERHKADVNLLDRWGNAPLSYAKDLATITLLCKKGAHVNQRFMFGYNALHFASFLEDEAPFLFLLTKGADMNAPSNYGRTAFYWACTKFSAKTIEQIVKSRPYIDLYAKAYDRKTAYTVASKGVKKLIKAKEARMKKLLAAGYTRAQGMPCIDGLITILATYLWLGALKGRKK